MASAVLLRSETRWECPNCTFTDVTRAAANETRMHNCRGMKAMSMPMIRAGTKCKVETTERGDYIGTEIVQVDGEGRPIMNAKVTREDGDDCFVYAPAAQMSAS